MRDVYQFIPAAICPKEHGSNGIYVKYHAFREVAPYCRMYTPWGIWIDTPDRELFIVGDAAKEGNVRPLNENYDEFISLSPLHMTAQDLNIKWGMVNYLQNTNPTYDHNYMEKYSEMPEGKRKFKIMSDSGGFQLGRGSINFINPKELAHWYHKNCDVGMSMDIPTGVHTDRSLLKTAAKIQRMNNDQMYGILKGLNSKTEIMNVIHGLNAKEQIEYHKAVFDPKFDRVSIAGMYRRSIFHATNLVYNLMFSDVGKHYSHVHILGVFNNKILPVYIWMFKMLNEKRKNPILMTSDASTAIQQALARCYLLLTEYDQSYHFQKLGLSNQTGHLPSRNIPSPFRTLSCACPVCSVVKYTDVFSFFKGRAVIDALTMHNMWQMSQYGDYMNTMSQQLDYKNYRDLVARQVGKRANRDTLDALDFIQHAGGGNSDKAEKKFSHYSGGKIKQYSSGGLFSDEVVEEEESATSAADKNKRLEEIFETYRVYHKTGIAPKTVKIQLEKKVGNLGHKSGSSHVKGKIRIKKR